MEGRGGGRREGGVGKEQVKVGEERGERLFASGRVRLCVRLCVSVTLRVRAPSSIASLLLRVSLCFFLGGEERGGEERGASVESPSRMAVADVQTLHLALGCGNDNVPAMEKKKRRGFRKKGKLEKKEK